MGSFLDVEFLKIYPTLLGPYHHSARHLTVPASAGRGQVPKAPPGRGLLIISQHYCIGAAVLRLVSHSTVNKLILLKMYRCLWLLLHRQANVHLAVLTITVTTLTPNKQHLLFV